MVHFTGEAVVRRRVIHQPIADVIVNRVLTAMQCGIARDRLSQVFVGQPSHLHTIGIEANTVTTTKTFGILEKEHLSAFTVEVFHLLVWKEPSINNAGVYLGNLNL